MRSKKHFNATIWYNNFYIIILLILTPNFSEHGAHIAPPESLQYTWCQCSLHIVCLVLRLFVIFLFFHESTLCTAVLIFFFPIHPFFFLCHVISPHTYFFHLFCFFPFLFLQRHFLKNYYYWLL